MTLTMSDVKKLQKEAARQENRAWWFAPDATAFFDSKIESDAISHKYVDTVYFVTSEQCHFSDGSSAARRYSIREWSPAEPARVKTNGLFQEFESKKEALAKINQLILQ